MPDPAPPPQPASAPRRPLLGPQDPPPFEVVNPDGAARVVLICDHAGQAIPAALKTLGLDEVTLARHIAWDIGIADVTRRLAKRLDAPAVLAGYSRLVIDCNRRLDNPTSIAQVSDGIDVPGNRGLTAAQRVQRAEACFQPYHDAVARLIEGRRRAGIVPALISMHSFTPVFGGVERPWHVGILWNRDPRIPVPLMERLAADPELCVGDNEPYTARDEHGYSTAVHGDELGLANVLIEIRQDLIDTRHGAESWADRLADALTSILVDDEIFRVVHYE
ncbi:N-formylglutamate amidohydrolase [Rhodospirillaceae bacterium SYSU D60014]|uniref:N-formylglutamate amidohydrolase n=1 Tax=Virgifigura deserti TaxID=2268457 RepID=UPI000E66C942